MIDEPIKQFADAIPGNIIITKHNHQILWWNQSAKNLFKQKHHPQSVSDLFTIPEHSNAFVSHLDSPANKTIKVVISHYDTYLLFYIQDISRQYQLEQPRQDFIANVSHELRTPLTVIHGYLEALLSQDGLPSQSQKIYSQMRTHSLRMQRLIEEILFLSRLESQHQHPSEWAIINMEKMLSSIVETAKEYSQGKNHQFKLVVDKNLLLKGVSNQMRSVFSNLIFNAAKYTQENGEISVIWQQSRHGAELVIKDNGIGIAKEHISRLTERFYRIDKGRYDPNSTGLGLSIVERVLTLHKAQLQITSEFNTGSTFTCLFPKKSIFYVATVS